jgi:hypothetical protein
MVSRCVGLGSYRLSQDNLAELCQIHLCPTTLGKIADATAGEIAGRLENNPDVRQNFQQAKGEIEFYADGTFVHIRYADGTKEWREFKLGAYAKRLCGASALPSEWHTRKLPNPTVVSAFAAIVDKDEFLQRCQTMRRTLGVGGVTSTLGDGAKWIWNVSRAVFGKTEECLDIYHGAREAADSRRQFAAEASDVSACVCCRLSSTNCCLLPGMERELQSLGSLEKTQQSAVDSLLEYLRNNEGRLFYAERLLRGRAIERPSGARGQKRSGLIERACKNLVGKRLKQTRACWRLPRANRIASLCATLYSSQWKIAH